MNHKFPYPIVTNCYGDSQTPYNFISYKLNYTFNYIHSYENKF